MVSSGQHCVNDWERTDMDSKQSCLSTSANFVEIYKLLLLLHLKSKHHRIEAKISSGSKTQVMCKYFYKRHSACGTQYDYPLYVLQCLTVRLRTQRIYFDEDPDDVPISYDRPCSRDPKTRRYVEVKEHECSTCEEKKKNKERKKGKKEKPA